MGCCEGFSFDESESLAFSSLVLYMAKNCIWLMVAMKEFMRRGQLMLTPL